MKVFISSLITGFEAARDAVASGIKTLGSQVIRAEDFGASPSSPQQACLAGVRDSDVTVLILGDRYGFTQASDLSATHEEYREARDAGPVLVFIQRGAKFEERQHDFVREVQGWERGHFTAEFTSDSDLRDKVINALHNFSLSQEAAPLDEAEVADRAIALASRRRTGNAQGLVLAVAGGPRRRTCLAAVGV